MKIIEANKLFTSKDWQNISEANSPEASAVKSFGVIYNNKKDSISEAMLEDALDDYWESTRG